MRGWYVHIDRAKKKKRRKKTGLKVALTVQ